MKERVSSFFTELTSLVGNLKMRGEDGLRIDGKFEGKIDSSSIVVVGESGDVVANITAESVISNGRIKGAVTARKSVVINNPGAIESDVRTCFLELEYGTYFSGTCRVMLPDSTKSKPRFLNFFKLK